MLGLARDQKAYIAYGRRKDTLILRVCPVAINPALQSRFDLNSNVGGACGEVAVYKGKWWRGLLNPLGIKLRLVPHSAGSLTVFSCRTEL